MVLLKAIFENILKYCCPPIHMAIYSDYKTMRPIKQILGFIWGFSIGMIFYFYLLRPLPIPHKTSLVLAFTVSILLGVGNAISIQMRCITLLTIPMFCGKAGRGVAKAIVLTFVIAGPIANLGVNAREVIRVFACSTSLSFNLTKAKYDLMLKPFRQALFGMKSSFPEIKETVKTFREVAEPLENEIEGDNETTNIEKENDYIDNKFGDTHRDDDIQLKYASEPNDTDSEKFEKKYLKKMELRCEDSLSKGAEKCIQAFAKAYDKCYEKMPWYIGWLLCWPMKLSFVCNVMFVVGGAKVCDSSKQIDPGLGEGYSYLKKSKSELVDKFQDAKLKVKTISVRELTDIQDAKETGKKILHDFEEKDKSFKLGIQIVKSLLAIIFLRVFIASQNYHDDYLTKITFDNIYITDYFRSIEARRHANRKYTLLPLKKMEKKKLINLKSLQYVQFERTRLFVQMLKVFLELMTATTFVMMDRLFYESLEVVKKHAEIEYTQQGEHDLDVEVRGTGVVAGLVRKILLGLNTKSRVNRTISNQHCLPRPHALPTEYYMKIYGGYIFILVLICLDAYTLRLRRYICSYFYPKHEKRRVLHLYNDLLKKRMKLKKTFLKNAMRNMRAYKMSAGDLLSLRLKFPKLLGWLSILPAARKKCLICGDTQPRSMKDSHGEWVDCAAKGCPFVFCPECWVDIGMNCIACTSNENDSSDYDSMSEDEASIE